jgi:hypothetical protein
MYQPFPAVRKRFGQNPTVSNQRTKGEKPPPPEDFFISFRAQRKPLDFISFLL